MLWMNIHRKAFLPKTSLIHLFVGLRQQSRNLEATNLIEPRILWTVNLTDGIRIYTKGKFRQSYAETRGFDLMQFCFGVTHPGIFG